jgi:alkanesulfonate monooxygenase SsuD/methylene tetrahydromethanopterin reductase-like flavin-dependent oxidoreductase (luciferase family)
MAMIDNISRGRLECGFVRGVPYELFSSNCNPTETSERLWESISLMQKAWTTHDGPFNYEGRWVHKRQVNVWPRPYQDPHMPIWMTGGSDVNHAIRSVENGFTFTMFLTPTAGMKKMFTGVRENLKKKGLPKPADDLFAFMPLVAVGETEEEALKFIKQVFWYVTNNKTEPQFRAPPGYVETELYANFLSGKFSGGRTDAIRTKGMDYFRENGVAVYGTPDQVVTQLKKMYKEIGGFGNLIAMLHSGDMPFKDVSKSMTLFAKEVVPQLKDLGTVSSKVGMLKDRGTPIPAKKFNGRTDALEAARAKSGVTVRSPRKPRKLAAA